MDIVKLTLETLFRGDIWRYVILAIVIVGSLFWMLSLAPISQNTTHHNFADTRDFHCVPNLLDVVINLPFLITFFSTLMVGFFALPIPHYLPNGNEGRHV